MYLYWYNSTLYNKRVFMVEFTTIIIITKPGLRHFPGVYQGMHVQAEFHGFPKPFRLRMRVFNCACFGFQCFATSIIRNFPFATYVILIVNQSVKIYK